MPLLPANTAYTMHPAAAAREVAGEIFVVTDDRGLHRLEVPTAVAIFRSLMAGPARRDTLIAQLVEDFEVEWEQAASDLDRFVNELVERRIAVECEPIAAVPLSSSAKPTTLASTPPQVSLGATARGAPMGPAGEANTATRHKN